MHPNPSHFNASVPSVPGAAAGAFAAAVRRERHPFVLLAALLVAANLLLPVASIVGAFGPLSVFCLAADASDDGDAGSGHRHSCCTLAAVGLAAAAIAGVFLAAPMGRHAPPVRRDRPRIRIALRHSLIRAPPRPA